ncbi:PE-PGRS family protein [Prauserella cavernicola]|uniref:PE-PGRS family protein n=1 Tax=Prauserella cavernicola TaxID=2800127 RepID=A0A934V7I6_9PSEU|nr:PE-PGRS family protein [Prauserella cavernicola]MBK1788622.1 PE-PGRS family protein [Prauserella cavernicola]
MTGRALPSTDRRYEWYSHEALKAQVESGNEPAEAGEIGREWSELAGALRDAGDAITGMSGESEQAWTGQGGDALRRVLASAAGWSREVAAVSQTLGDAVGSQAEAAARARAEMPEPVPYEPGDLIRSAVAAGDIGALAGLSGMLSAMREESEAARQRAIDVLYARDAALREAVPPSSFSAPPPLTSGSAQGGPVPR